MQVPRTKKPIPVTFWQTVKQFIDLLVLGFLEKFRWVNHKVAYDSVRYHRCGYSQVSLTFFQTTRFQGIKIYCSRPIYVLWYPRRNPYPWSLGTSSHETLLERLCRIRLIDGLSRVEGLRTSISPLGHIVEGKLEYVYQFSNVSWISK